jgi:hypothetical protein
VPVVAAPMASQRDACDYCKHGQQQKKQYNNKALVFQNFFNLFSHGKWGFGHHQWNDRILKHSNSSKFQTSSAAQK